MMKKDIDNIVNGNMVSNMEELKQLGKQMEHMRDEMQLEEDGRINDPEQFDDE
ncbi:MAG: hypothetical protein ABS882_10955 [Lysinibacillus sp.]